MINLLILIGIVVTTVILNLVTTKQILDSSIPLKPDGRKIIVAIWLLPVFGALMAVSRLRQQAEVNQQQVEQAMIEKVNQLTSKIDGMRAQVEQKRGNKLH